MEIVGRAEVLAEEQTEELPRRKGSRGSSSEPAPVALVPDEEESEGAIGSSETVPDGDDDFADSDSEEAASHCRRRDCGGRFGIAYRADGQNRGRIFHL